MTEKEKHLDEELEEFLMRCYQLKQRALRELSKKNTFPAWLQCLLHYPPLKDESAREEK